MMRDSIKRWYIYGALCLFVMMLFLGVQWLRFVSTPLTTWQGMTPVIVTPGMTGKDLARNLSTRGITSSPRFFSWLARWKQLDRKLQAGEYAVVPGVLPSMFLAQIANGRVVLHPFTIVEGWTLDQVRNALNQNSYVIHQTKGLSDRQLIQALGLHLSALEGTLLPQTYLFPRQEPDLAILKRAHDAMQDYLKTAWAGRPSGLSYKTPLQALVVASLVEKETAVDAERPKIAGIILQRLKRGMFLQIDSTVIYGLDGKIGDRGLTRSDLRKVTPYNTYRHKGLPPTPIAMPSPSSIMAALHPQFSRDLYFVARGDGTHQFSTNLKAHNRAVRRYQLRHLSH